MKGISFYLLPDFSKITLDTLYPAMGHAFFSLSLGMGALITYGSYVKKNQNIMSAAFTITIMDMSIAFLAGLMIFPLIFSQGVPPNGGPSLVFVVLPGIFNAFGSVLGKIVGGSFFLLLCFAALTSTISLLEVPVAYFVDEKNLPRKKVTWLIAAFIFIVGLPSMLSQGVVPALNRLPFYHDKTALDFVAEVFSEVCLPLGGCLMCLFIVLRWGQHNMSKEIYEGNPGFEGSFLEKYINFTIRFVCPILLGLFSILIVLDKLFSVTLEDIWSLFGMGQ
jgi:NSS family neurotransmitter:Na+ symporter